MATVTELQFIISSKATVLCCKLVELFEGPRLLVTAAFSLVPKPARPIRVIRGGLEPNFPNKLDR